MGENRRARCKSERVKFWHFGVLATTAGLCLAPSCTEAEDLADAGLEDDAGADASSAAGLTKRQTDSTNDCKKRGACLVQNRETFSQSECETLNRNEGERADSRSCTTEYDAYLACAAGITYDCTNAIAAQLVASCNAAYQTLGTCLAR